MDFLFIKYNNLNNLYLSQIKASQKCMDVLELWKYDTVNLFTSLYSLFFIFLFLYFLILYPFYINILHKEFEILKLFQELS
jgi:hypothetical protein